MTEPKPLPHDPYISAVIDALAADDLEPDDFRTSGAEIDRYDSGPDAGRTTMLDAYLDWDTSPAHAHGIALLWEHPAEEWMWAPRAEAGHLAHDPEFLPGLPRWTHPDAVVAAVRNLLGGLDVPPEAAALWAGYAEAQAAVDAWAETES